MKISALRKEYQRDRINRTDLLADPLEQFKRWFSQAQTAELNEPNAMVLATVDEQGRPQQRHVLLKHVDSRGFVFFTNTASRKARHIGQQPNVSLIFGWLELERQVSIRGRAVPLTRAEVMRYFFSRPRNSQIAALASTQSQPINSRASLESRFASLKQQFAGRSIPAPADWGGYRITPDEMEFWQGGAARLHDRFQYRRQDDQWQLQRLAP